MQKFSVTSVTQKIIPSSDCAWYTFLWNRCYFQHNLPKKQKEKKHWVFILLGIYNFIFSTSLLDEDGQENLLFFFLFFSRIERHFLRLLFFQKNREAEVKWLPYCSSSVFLKKSSNVTWTLIVSMPLLLKLLFATFFYKLYY